MPPMKLRSIALNSAGCSRKVTGAIVDVHARIRSAARGDMKPLRQAVEVQAPVFGAVGRVMGTEVSAMKQHEMRSGLEIAGADASMSMYFSFFTAAPPVTSTARGSPIERPPPARQT